MKVAKEFKWEMGHRLPLHFDKCKNIHGHSYRMIIEFEGNINSGGMVIDYYDIEKLAAPIVDKLDHAFMVYKEDLAIIEFLQKMNSKMIVVDFHSTVENICSYMLREIILSNLPGNIESITVRIYETSDDYAEEKYRR